MVADERREYDNRWICRVPGHGAGGPLELIAVMDDRIDIDCADIEGGGWSNEHPLAYLKACLYARG